MYNFLSNIKIYLKNTNFTQQLNFTTILQQLKNTNFCNNAQFYILLL